MTFNQLTIDGREVPHPDVRDRRRQPPLTPLQRGILAVIQDHGFVTSTEAGVLEHRLRGHCVSSGATVDRWWPGPASAACCSFAASDGSMACKRLAARGYLKRLCYLRAWTTR